MRSVHQDFRLDDRHQVLFLAERGISREGVCVHSHAVGARQYVVYVDHGPPFCEAGAHAAVRREAIAQTVETLGDGLVRRTGERLRADIDLDAGKDALSREDLAERRAGGTLLMDRLVIHDDAADELGDARGGEQHLPIGAAALFSRPDPERVEPFRQGRNSLVGGENPFPFGNKRQRDAFQVVASHADSPSVVPLSTRRMVHRAPRTFSNRRNSPYRVGLMPRRQPEFPWVCGACGRLFRYHLSPARHSQSWGPAHVQMGELLPVQLVGLAYPRRRGMMHRMMVRRMMRQVCVV